MQFRYITHNLILSCLVDFLLLLLDFSARPKQERQQGNQIDDGHLQ
jgi:hypothetical protein